jgi:eukaryotic-like serine/threonine-protein kinase
MRWPSCAPGVLGDAHHVRRWDTPPPKPVLVSRLPNARLQSTVGTVSVPRDLEGLVFPAQRKSSPQWGSLLAETSLVPGFRLGTYEILCPIARGGMASVWIGRRMGVGAEELVAIKTMLPHHSRQLRSQRMFLDEARIASGVDHVHVVRILDFGEQAGVLYLVMEWVDGDSLLTLQRAVQHTGAQVSPGIALRVVADACSGLHAAHELRDPAGAPLGVVHRDVSPQNILLNGEGTAKVIDFGIAKARHRVAGDTTDGGLRGKLLYISPEQALGLPVDRRADVWSLGAVLYDLLAGDPPFQAATDEATFAFLTSPLPPRPLPSRIPGPVANVVRKALSPLEERYPTAADLQRAIEDAMAESGLMIRREDVAEYVERHLGGLVAARKAVVQKAQQIAGPPIPRRGRIAKRAVQAAGLLAAGLLVAAVGHGRTGSRASDNPVGAASTPAAQVAVLPSEALSPRAGPGGDGADRLAAVPATGTATAPLPEPRRSGTPARPQRASAHDCDPPFEFDSDGIRRYKRACLRGPGLKSAP